MMAVSAPLNETVVGDANGGSLEATEPAGAESGDFEIAIHANNVSNTPQTNTGWTFVESLGGAFIRSKVTSHLRGESQPDLEFGSNQVGSDAKLVLFRLTGVLQSAPLNDSDSADDGVADTSATCPSITTTVPNCRIIYIVVAASNSLPATFAGISTNDYDDSSYSMQFSIASEIQAAAGPTGTKDVTLQASGHCQCFTLAIAPAPSGHSQSTSMYTLWCFGMFS